MKVPTRRWGNARKLVSDTITEQASMKVPARKRGNVHGALQEPFSDQTSMKVPARRWGNYRSSFKHFPFQQNLNESSRPKAGKFSPPNRMVDYSVTLMKVPDRRRGNSEAGATVTTATKPQ